MFVNLHFRYLEELLGEKLNTFRGKTGNCASHSGLRAKNIRRNIGEVFQQCCRNRNIHVQNNLFWKDNFFERKKKFLMTFGF